MCRSAAPTRAGRSTRCRALPDHWTSIEEADDAASVPAGDLAGARLSQFDVQRDADLAGARGAADGDDPSRRCARRTGIADGDYVVLGNTRGEVRLHARLFDGLRRGVLIAELIWPNSAYADGCGINTLTGADAIAPFGGAAFHDNKVWIRRLAP